MVPMVHVQRAPAVQAARSIAVMLARPAERLIVGHAEVVERGGRDRLAEAWRLEGVAV